MIPASFADQLKEALAIEDVIRSYVDLKPRGRYEVGLCPFHGEKTPSFTIYKDSQSFYCFGCQAGGDVITFIEMIENLEYPDAVQLLAERANLAVPLQGQENEEAKLRQRILELNRTAALFFHDQLISPQGQQAYRYLTDRGLTRATIRNFGLGYSLDSWDSLRNHLQQKGFTQQEALASTLVRSNREGTSTYDMFRGRIMFPIINLRGNVIAFGGRRLHEDDSGHYNPKYINSPDTPVYKKSRNLFAMNFAKNTDSDMLILGEGYMDVIAMHQAGFTNAIATLGTALTAEQARIISQYAKRVTIAYDADEAGQEAARRAINLFSDSNVSVSILQMEGAKDPDEYIKKFGATRFRNLLESGQSAMDFEIDKLRRQHNVTLPEGKVDFLDGFCRLMSGINNPLQREVYISQIAGELNVSKSNLETTVNQMRGRSRYAKKRQQSRELATSASEQAGTEERRSRYHQNLSGVIAEEQLITLLMRHPDFFDRIGGRVTAADFTDSGFQAIYAVLADKLEQNQPIDLIHFSGQLPPHLMGQLTQLMIKGQQVSFYNTQVDDYVQAIKQTQQPTAQDVANMTPEEYQEYIATLKADKF